MFKKYSILILTCLAILAILNGYFAMELHNFLVDNNTCEIYTILKCMEFYFWVSCAFTIQWFAIFFVHI